jgi:hypothetical protein
MTGAQMYASAKICFVIDGPARDIFAENWFGKGYIFT